MMTCAMASYYLVERPIRLWGRRFRLSEAKAMAHFKVAA
jgi:peptidoglycan/LPS O-acetylase OafA/YrhL